MDCSWPVTVPTGLFVGDHGSSGGLGNPERMAIRFRQISHIVALEYTPSCRCEATTMVFYTQWRVLCPTEVVAIP